MNIKTFMAAAVIALTAACAPNEEAPTVSEAPTVAEAGPAADEALAAAETTEADVPQVDSLVCDSQTPTAACDAQPK